MEPDLDGVTDVAVVVDPVVRGGTSRRKVAPSLLPRLVALGRYSLPPMGCECRSAPRWRWSSSGTAGRVRRDAKRLNSRPTARGQRGGAASPHLAARWSSSPACQRSFRRQAAVTMLYAAWGKQRPLVAPVRASSSSSRGCGARCRAKSYLWRSSSTSAASRSTCRARKRSAFS